MEKLLHKTFSSFLSFLKKLFKFQYPLYFIGIYLNYKKILEKIKTYIQVGNKIQMMMTMVSGNVNNDVYFFTNKYFMEVLKFNHKITKTDKKELKEIKKYESDLILLLKRTLEGI